MKMSKARLICIGNTPKGTRKCQGSWWFAYRAKEMAWLSKHCSRFLCQHWSVWGYETRAYWLLQYLQLKLRGACLVWTIPLCFANRSFRNTSKLSDSTYHCQRIYFLSGGWTADFWVQKRHLCLQRFEALLSEMYQFLVLGPRNKLHKWAALISPSNCCCCCCLNTTAYTSCIEILAAASDSDNKWFTSVCCTCRWGMYDNLFFAVPRHLWFGFRYC